MSVRTLALTACLASFTAPTAGLAQADGPPPPVLNPPRIIMPLGPGGYRDRVIRAFKEDLAQDAPGGTVGKCGLVIDDIHPSESGKDTSWGVVCAVTSADGARGRSIMACDDRFVGKFTMKIVVAATQDDLIDFTDEHCPPGG